MKTANPAIQQRASGDGECIAVLAIREGARPGQHLCNGHTGISLGDTLARLAAGEAIIGLLIEITFIATFTQRFFAR